MNQFASKTILFDKSYPIVLKILIGNVNAAVSHYYDKNNLQDIKYVWKKERKKPRTIFSERC